MEFGFKISVAAFVILLAMFIMIANLYQNYSPLDSTRQGEVQFLFWLIMFATFGAGYLVWHTYETEFKGSGVGTMLMNSNNHNSTFKPMKSFLN